MTRRVTEEDWPSRHLPRGAQGKGDRCGKDVDVLDSINHSSVIRYLDRRGWSKAEELLNGVVCVFEKDGQVLEVVTRPDLPSYKDRLRQAVTAIAISENREESGVAQDVVHSGSAKLSLRVNPDLPQHYLKLEESKSLRNAMYDIEEHVGAVSFWYWMSGFFTAMFWVYLTEKSFVAALAMGVMICATAARIWMEKKKDPPAREPAGES